MKNKISPFEVTSVLLMLCFFSADSFGYIDPNSGYILWQMLFGVIVGCFFFAKKIWFFIKGIFIREKSTDSTPS
jgi:hypothetical protein